MVELEICVDSLESARNAAEGGCSRIELCSALSEGGLTPTPSFLRAVKKIVSVPVFCMVRCRGGHMTFSPEEAQVMVSEAEELKAAGADGIVFGALNEDNGIDRALCATIRKVAGSLPCTFHRAFDLLTPPLEQHVQTVVDLGYSRILTSGGSASAPVGWKAIASLVSEAQDKPLSVMAGAGVTSSNVGELLGRTGVRQIHASAKVCRSVQKRSGPNMGAGDDSKHWVTDREEVTAIKTKAAQINS